MDFVSPATVKREGENKKIEIKLLAVCQFHLGSGPDDRGDAHLPISRQKNWFPLTTTALNIFRLSSG